MNKLMMVLVMAMTVVVGGCGIELHYNGAPLPAANVESEAFRLEFETLRELGLVNGLELEDLSFTAQPWAELFDTCRTVGDCFAVTNGRGHIWIADVPIPEDHCNWEVAPDGHENQSDFYPGTIMHEMLHNVGYGDSPEMDALEAQAVAAFKAGC